MGELVLEGFDLGAALGIEPEEQKAAKVEQGSIKVSHRMGARQLWRKAASEQALEQAMDWHWQEGDSYHLRKGQGMTDDNLKLEILRGGYSLWITTEK